MIDRVPCREIYDSMSIDFDGTSRMCCVDGYRETNLGNVFKDGVLDVWKGGKYNEVRKSHEDKNTKIDPFCETCDQWAGFNIINEYESEKLLIRETAFSTYYNRIDKLSNWTSDSKRLDEI